MATAPISDTETRADYTATASQTTFAYTWWIKDEDHLDVYVNGTLKTLTTDYTVSAVQSVTGANVVFNSGLTSGDAVAIVYNPDVERATEFQTSGAFKATSLNLEFTYLISLIQWLQTKADRVMRLSDATPSTFDTSLPTPEALNLLRWNNAAGALENVTASEIGSSIVAGNYIVETFSDGVDYTSGTTTQLTLANSPGAEQNTQIYFDGGYQEKGTYTLSGLVITFDAAIPAGTNNVEVVTAGGVTIGTPSDGTVTTDKLGAAAVTNAKIATGDTVLKDNIDDDLITNYTTATLATGDELLFSDVDDSNNMKKDTVQGVLDLVPTDLYGKTGATVAAGDTFVLWDADDSNSVKTDTVQGILDLVPASTSLTESTEQATTSGTAFDFTSIPAGTKRITVQLESCSLDGTDHFLVQIGDSGGIETTGYASTSTAFSASSNARYGSTAGFMVAGAAATTILSGSIILTRKDSANNTWVAQGVFAREDATTNQVSSGIKTLSAELDRIRLTRSGSDNFDGGSVNITYE